VAEGIDVHNQAQFLVLQHGKGAVLEALRRAGDMLAAGNVQRFWEWIEVMAAVKDILKNHHLPGIRWH
jgi:hypothetical protein